MKIAEIRKLSTEEVAKLAMDLRSEIVDTKRSLYNGQLTNYKLVRSKRKELARALTILSENLSKEKI
jgi:ribosomal protein L29